MRFDLEDEVLGEDFGLVGLAGLTRAIWVS